MQIKGRGKLVGEITVPGDKSISHRAVILGSISHGRSLVNNILFSDDTLRTIDCFRDLGVLITKDEVKNRATIEGVGLYGLKMPSKALDCENSGTTMRLLSGLLVGQPFPTKLLGDKSLSKRPMKRIIDPLKLMGANIKGTEEDQPPLIINPTNGLTGIDYSLPVASAQVKSAILLAGLYSSGTTNVFEKNMSRDHTERMLDYFQANIKYNSSGTRIKSGSKLIANDIFVPGDISSASFFIVGACILEGSSILIKDVGLNPSRTGIIKVLKSMGASIEIIDKNEKNNETYGDLKVEYKPLHGVILEGDIIGTLIDEIPIIAVAAAFAQGQTIIRNAEELKFKETDRIHAIARELRKMNCNIEELEDGLIIYGGQKLKAARVNSHNDHRIAMALTIAALTCSQDSKLENHTCINVSYPNFFQDLGKLMVNI